MPASVPQDLGHVGQATFYDVGMGSCGFESVPSDYIVALSHVLMEATYNPNPNKNVQCGKYTPLIDIGALKSNFSFRQENQVSPDSHSHQPEPPSDHGNRCRYLPRMRKLPFIVNIYGYFGTNIF